VAQETFVANYLATTTMSPEATALLDAGRAVYSEYYNQLPNLQHAKYHLQAWNPGWYQIRMALQAEGLATTGLAAVKTSLLAMKAKLEPQVYSSGFLDP
jgi:hypothetical protein